MSSTPFRFGAWKRRHLVVLALLLVALLTFGIIIGCSTSNDLQIGHGFDTWHNIPPGEQLTYDPIHASSPTANAVLGVTPALVISPDVVGAGIMDDLSSPSAVPGSAVGIWNGASETSERFNTAPKPAQPDQPPQVWKRNRAQPTMARVYVGDGNSLELVSLQVTTTIEGPRARAPSSITSSAIRTTNASKAPSSIRCRPGPARATSPCSSARRATPYRAALNPGMV